MSELVVKAGRNDEDLEEGRGTSAGAESEISMGVRSSGESPEGVEAVDCSEHEEGRGDCSGYEGNEGCVAPEAEEDDANDNADEDKTLAVGRRGVNTDLAEEGGADCGVEGSSG